MTDVAAHRPGTAFFNRTYDEAMSLLLEARNYLTYGDARDRARLSPVQRLTVSCETMRLTSRLTQVMAWLLVQKAVHAGEMTEDQAASDEFRLSGHSVCTIVTVDVGQVIPMALRSLLDRSFSLYERVSRLDDQIVTVTRQRSVAIN